MVFGANWRRANVKSGMVPKTPARLMYGRNRKNGEKERCTGKNPSRITPVKLRCEWLVTFVGRTNFDFFARSAQRAVYMLDDISAGANSVFWLALSRPDRHVLALLLVRVDCGALCLWYDGNIYLMMLGRTSYL